MSLVELEINGKKISQDVEERQLLVHFIRDDLNLTGTHVGCDTSQCGACVIHIDGKAVKSCSMLTVQANDTKITTISKSYATCESMKEGLGCAGVQIGHRHLELIFLATAIATTGRQLS